MPSPFPGMDPYLEAPDIWPDFHDALANEIRNELNHSLPAPYYARLGARPEEGIVEEGRTRLQMIPDISVAVLDRPRRDVSKAIEVTLQDEPIRHHFVEVRDAKRGHALVTLIEILSPSNKRPGPDRVAYRAKQREVGDGGASLIEIDLLREGERVYPEPGLAAVIEEIEPRGDYLVLVNRAWKRGAVGVGYEVFPSVIRDWLPCIPVPLREGEDDTPLDLQYVVNRAYDGGPYLRGAVDYARPPEPPLKTDDADWANALIRARGLAAPS